jgi:hypothetical protein
MNLRKLINIFEAAPQAANQAALNKAGSAIGAGYAKAAAAGAPAPAAKPPVAGAAKLPVAGAAKPPVAGAAKPAASPAARPGTAAAGVAFNQGAAPPTPPSAGNEALKGQVIGAGAPNTTTPAEPSGAAAAMASKSAAPTGADASAGGAAKPAAAAPSTQGSAAGFAPAASTPTTPEPAAAAPSTQGSAAGFAPAPASSGGAAKPVGSYSATGMVGTDFEESVEESDETEIEEDFEQAFSEMRRLSGLPIMEKAVSKQQQKFMGMVHAMQKGEKVKGASAELKAAAKGMSKKDAKDFASTKHKGLPKKVTEGVMLEAGSTLEHIVNKFKHETKKFINGEDLDTDLYEALFDYYSDNGEMPYGVAKARDGDPYTWIEDRFEDELSIMGYPRTHDELNYRGDQDLTELALLAGLTEGGNPYKGVPSEKGTPMGKRAEPAQPQPRPSSPSTPSAAGQGAKPVQPQPRPDTSNVKKDPEAGSEPQPKQEKSPFDRSADELTECGDMDMDQQDSFNVSTNMSSDGTKSVNISAQGDRADELLQMLKMAGMRPHDDHDHSMMSEPEIIMIGNDDEMMEQELEEAKKRKTRYSNTPDEEYETVAAITRQGNDLNREKRQYASKPRLGDNPMAESTLDADLDAMLESILIREEESKTWLQRQPSKSQEEIAKDWDERVKASKDYVIPAERPYKDEKTGRMITPPKGATNPPPDSEFPPGDKRNMMPPKRK